MWYYRRYEQAQETITFATVWRSLTLTQMQLARVVKVRGVQEGALHFFSIKRLRAAEQKSLPGTCCCNLKYGGHVRRPGWGEVSCSLSLSGVCQSGLIWLQGIVFRQQEPPRGSQASRLRISPDHRASSVLEGSPAVIEPQCTALSRNNAN